MDNNITTGATKPAVLDAKTLHKAIKLLRKRLSIKDKIVSNEVMLRAFYGNKVYEETIKPLLTKTTV